MLFKSLSSAVSALLWLKIPYARAIVPPFENIEDYTVKWFMDNVNEQYRDPNVLRDTCLFYSTGLSTVAQKIGPANGYITIWDIWGPCTGVSHLFDDRQVASNPLRTIVTWVEGKPTKVALTYFARMSRAMAFLCSGKVRSIHKDRTKIPEVGIFRNVELRALLQRSTKQIGLSGVVTEILGIDVNECKMDDTARGFEGKDISELPTVQFRAGTPPAELWHRFGFTAYPTALPRKRSAAIEEARHVFEKRTTAQGCDVEGVMDFKGGDADTSDLDLGPDVD